MPYEEGSIRAEAKPREGDMKKLKVTAPRTKNRIVLTSVLSLKNSRFFLIVLGAHERNLKQLQQRIRQVL
jgi:hypothetical protein